MERIQKKNGKDELEQVLENLKYRNWSQFLAVVKMAINNKAFFSETKKYNKLKYSSINNRNNK